MWNLHFVIFKSGFWSMVVDFKIEKKILIPKLLLFQQNPSVWVTMKLSLSAAVSEQVSLVPGWALSVLDLLQLENVKCFPLTWWYPATYQLKIHLSN